jgi:uncharacterized protein YdeI (YjbR/CyaY-like superfamily)
MSQGRSLAAYRRQRLLPNDSCMRQHKYSSPLENNMNSAIQPTFFASQSDFRKWLEENHDREKELFVGFHKVGSGQPCMSWSESVDQALCFGWIDGVRKSIDKNGYFIRFSPRKPKSNWSAVNIKKVDALTQQGLMKPAGLAAYHLREEKRSGIYAYEKEALRLSAEFEKQFRANKIAWEFFQTLPPSYHKSAINWVMSAKQEATRIKRLADLIADSAAGRKIKPLSY